MTLIASLSAHRRPLATAAAAAGVLFALGFVPSAQASPEPVPPADQNTRAVPAEAAPAAADPEVLAGPRLYGGAGDADPAGAPYVFGAVAVAGAGGLLAARVRLARRQGPSWAGSADRS